MSKSRKTYNDTWDNKELTDVLKTIDRDTKKTREESRHKKRDKNDDTDEYVDVEKKKSSKQRDEDDEERRRRKKERKHAENERDEDEEAERRRHRKHREEKEDEGKSEKKSRHRGEDEDRERRHREKKKGSDNENGERRERDRRDSDDEYERRKHRKHRDNEDEKDDADAKRRHHKSNKKDKQSSGDEEKKSEMKILKQVIDGSDDKKSHSSKKSAEAAKEEYNENYEDDYEPDFDDDEDNKSDKSSVKNSKPAAKAEEKKRYNNRDEDDYDYKNEKIIKAHKHVNLPTEDVRVTHTQVFFNHDSADRQRRRAKDLLKIIELDKKSFSLFDINPSELSTVYASNMKHAKVQTNDGTDEIEIQTDDIDMVNKWTQNPSTDTKECGGDRDDNSNHNFSIKYKLDYDTIRVQSFLSKATQLIESILQEKKALYSNSVNANKQSKLEFCVGYSSASMPEFITFERTPVTSCAFCSNDEQLFVVAFSYKQKAEYFNKTILIVWNIDDLENPHKYLTQEGVSTSTSFASSLVFSGNSDGSVAVWDIREADHLHKFTAYRSSDEIVFRNPTYTTAGVLQYENHSSEVVCVNVLHNSMKTGDLSMQIATLESNSMIIIWTVIENKDSSLETTDLGLLPGGKIKLIKSTQINLNANFITQPSYHSLWMCSPNNDTNNFFVCTDIGKIRHVSRDGGLCAPSVMKSQFTNGILEVKCIVFHHEIEDVILAGYGNGELRLYNAKYRDPLNSWMFFAGTNSIEKIEWVKCKYSAAIVLDSSNTFYYWDFLTDDTQPIKVSQYDNSVICTAVSVYNANVDGSELNYKLLVCDSKNKVKLQVLKPDYVQLHKKEKKNFEKLVKSYLNEF